MRYANSIKVSVFAKQEEAKEKILENLLSLFPFDLEKEKIKIEQRTVTGFAEQPIKVFEVMLVKERHTNAFLKNLTNKISKEQKELLMRQAGSRLNADLNFYIRLDKEKLLEGKFWVTDKGECFHIRINLAVFPKKEEKALNILKELFS